MVTKELLVYSGWLLGSCFLWLPGGCECGLNGNKDSVWIGYSELLPRSC